MIETIFLGMMEHLDFIDRSNSLSMKILKLTKQGKLKEVITEQDNRDRLVATIEMLQKKVEESFNNLNANLVDQEFINIAKSWALDVEQWIILTNEIDQETTNILEEMRENTGKEIGAVYHNRTKFGGYNLANVKK